MRLFTIVHKKTRGTFWGGQVSQTTPDKSGTIFNWNVRHAILIHPLAFRKPTIICQNPMRPEKTQAISDNNTNEILQIGPYIDHLEHKLKAKEVLDNVDHNFTGKIMDNHMSQKGF